MTIDLNGNQFYWATGIENSFIPQVRPGLRAMDEYELTQHYTCWKEDIDRMAEIGVQMVRWGVPWYRVQPAKDRWDWSWTDAVLDYMVNVKGLTPILDLMHYGTPLWLDNSFINAGYPERVAEYAAVVMDRYRSLLRLYTPMNEPVINSEYGGRRGEWPPYLKGDDGFVKMMNACARGIVRTVQTLQASQPDLTSVHVEALWKFWFHGEDPVLKAQVERNHARQFLSFDLCIGKVDEKHPLYTYLWENGFTDTDFSWFSDNRVSFDVFGANYYPWSYGPVALRKDGTRFYRLQAHTPGGTLADRLKEVYRRYQMPVMITETSARAGIPGRARWMDQTIQAVRELRLAGAPLVGYTWFPLFTMFNWDYRRGRKPLRDYRIHLGLFDCDFDADGVFQRQATPLVERYRGHMAEPMPLLPDSVDWNTLSTISFAAGSRSPE